MVEQHYNDLFWIINYISLAKYNTIIKNIILVKDMPPVKDDLIREINCLDVSLIEKSPAKGTALVDVRACNKPVAKVRWIYYF